MRRDGRGYFARERLRLTRPRLRRGKWVLNETDLIYLIEIGIFVPDPEWLEGLPQAFNIRIIDENNVTPFDPDRRLAPR